MLVVAQPARTRGCRYARCTSAGEALPREIGEHFAAHFGCEILDGIGSTEMLHIFLSNRAGDVEYGTTGTAPCPAMKSNCATKTAIRYPTAKSGDLYIKGPKRGAQCTGAIARSRARRSLANGSAAAINIVDLANGCYVYAGRSDDMLKVSGQYVSPVEVEMVLVQHDAVLEAAVVGVDHGGLVKTRAFVVLKRDFAPSEILADGAARISSKDGSRRTSIRAISCSSTICRKPLPARFNASNCANSHKVIHAEPRNRNPR